jgi:hypothetical protein
MSCEDHRCPLAPYMSVEGIGPNSHVGRDWACKGIHWLSGRSCWSLPCVPRWTTSLWWGSTGTRMGECPWNPPYSGMWGDWRSSPCLSKPMYEDEVGHRWGGPSLLPGHWMGIPEMGFGWDLENDNPSDTPWYCIFMVRRLMMWDRNHYLTVWFCWNKPGFLCGCHYIYIPFLVAHPRLSSGL